MSAVSSFLDEPSPEDAEEKMPIRLLKFVPDGKLKSGDKSKEVLALETHVRELREELIQTQRQLGRLELLLQNARLREQELRTQLLKQK
ncbi:MAG: hypothetical protein JST84_26525 [Acidobacteria bacterium]|nr:hypothetical protein [Acidobacteriota bacterium]